MPFPGHRRRRRGVRSSRVHIVDVATDPRAPRIHKVIEPEELKAKTGLSAPHTIHCMPGNNVVMSMLGDADATTAPGSPSWTPGPSSGLLASAAAGGRRGLAVDPDCFVDFAPAKAHEVHLPGGDPTTGIVS